jgi:hypothetical protein
MDMHCVPSFLRQLSRLVLVGYVMFVGVSVLAATLQTKTMDVVCSTMGVMKLVVQGEDGEIPLSASMGCPLCAHITPVMPPPRMTVLGQVRAAQHVVVPVLTKALRQVNTAPPLPSRGPPDLI